MNKPDYNPREMIGFVNNMAAQKASFGFPAEQVTALLRSLPKVFCRMVDRSLEILGAATQGIKKTLDTTAAFAAVPVRGISLYAATPPPSGPVVR